MKLLLLTKQYPYGTEEAFIENEISIASKYFEEIIIVACEVPNGLKNKRAVPNNVFVYSISKDNDKKQKVKDLFGFCVRKKRDNEYHAENKRTIGISKKLFLAYFDEKCRRIYNTIENLGVLESLEPNNYVLYSYWLFTTAKVGLYIKNRVNPYKCISRAHRYDLYEERNKTNYLPYREEILNGYDFIYPCSEDGTKYLIDKYKCKGQIKTQYLGTIDHGITKNDSCVFTVVSCSRVEPVKRVKMIFEGLEKVTSNNVKIRWIHIGDGSLFNDLSEYIKNANNNLDCVLLGNRSNKEVLDYYSNNAIDLFINVSSSEGLPVSIMEAMSFGIPVVATNVGGTSEIVNEKTGILLNEDFTIDEFEKAVTYFTNIYKTQRINQYKENCRDYWKSNFQAILNYERMYDELRIK